MKVIVSYEFSTIDEAAAFLNQEPAQPPVVPPPDPPPPQPPPSTTDVWQTTNPTGPNYWPPIFGPPPDMKPSAYFAAGYQIPYRPNDPPVTPPVEPPQPPPSTGDGLPADLILGYTYKTILWVRGNGVASFYRWEEPMCALQKLMYEIKTSGKALAVILDEFEIDHKKLALYNPQDSEVFESFLRRAWDEAYHGDTSRLYQEMYGSIPGEWGPAKLPYWQWMMQSTELGFSPAVRDDYGRGSKRAYGNYWLSDGTYLGNFDTNYGFIEPSDSWWYAIKTRWGIK